MTPKIEIFDQIFAHFSSFEESFLTILVVKKVVFWVFWKLIWSCLRNVWALFLALYGLLLCIFSARKVDTWPRKTEIHIQKFGHFGSFEGSCLTILRVKKYLFWTSFKVVLDLFKECLSIVFGLKYIYFWLYFHFQCPTN